MRIRPVLWAFLVSSICSPANPIRSGGPCLENNIARPLRYQPEGTDFVIRNGGEWFNRPLYGGNSAFRVDGGDMPEFVLYFPGRGGNLRLGIAAGGKAKWLHQAEQIETRYRPGSLVHEIYDKLLGNGGLRLTTLATRSGEGLVMRAERMGNGPDFELCWAFGGMDGSRGRRDGDIGCEPEPVGRLFQLRPELCAEDAFELTGNAVAASGKAGKLRGFFPVGARLFTASASCWDDAGRLMDNPDLPGGRVLAGRVAVSGSAPLYIHFARPETLLAKAPDPAALFASEEKLRGEIAGQVVVETPDPFVNAAAAALNIAADAVWDSRSKAFMHGAVAWRTRLLGWRGPYAGDFLGRHDRSLEHLEGYFRRQNDKPVADVIPPSEDASRLARNESALHSNGDLTNSHYDMNLVAIDVFFRHLMWTGDLQTARRYWPVIERHLAWQRRLFRREFGSPPLPLYEAYACIWASDDLACHGGGAAHSTAYNIWHNRMAAELAALLGKDPKPYADEADLATRGMRRELWLEDRGCFGEFKDLLGLQMVHADPALWTFYHTLDNQLPDAREAWRMSRDIDRRLPRIPLTGPGVPEGCFTLPTTNWMPYSWSINNVVFGESMHGSLGYWQCGRPDTAFALFKGAALDSMFMGLCPGNVGMCTSFDVYRGESQRDFADGAGAMSRALVEGLFGIRPDLLQGEIRIRPGFPDAWDKASIRHPDLDFSFRRNGTTDIYQLTARFSKPVSLRLEVPARLDRVALVKVNGSTAKFEVINAAVGRPVIAVRSPAAANHRIEITWAGNPPVRGESTAGFKEVRQGDLSWVQAPGSGPASGGPLIPAGLASAGFWRDAVTDAARWETVSLTKVFNAKVTDIFRNDYVSPRSPYVSLSIPRQGVGSWCHPDGKFEVDDSGLRAAALHDGRIRLSNGIPVAVPAEAVAPNIAFVSQWDNYPREIRFPLHGRARRAVLMVAGSTNAMQSRIDNGELIVAYQDGSVTRLALSNPETWWPIDQDYFIDDFAFRHELPLPPRCDLKTGKIRVLEAAEFKGHGKSIAGGAATLLVVDLVPDKELASITVRALANEVVVGLMGVTLERP